MKDSKIDWGCPDWREPAAYLAGEAWDAARWRWEFKRRWNGVRGLFASKAIEWAVSQGLNPVDAMWLPELREHNFCLSPSQAARLGYSCLTNPLGSISPDQADREAVAWFDDSPEDGSEAMARKFNARRLQEYHITHALKAGLPFPSLMTGIFLAFDPDAPIEPQIDGLREYLQSHRHHSYRSDILRKHTGKWISYLRFIDANDQGGTLGEMADKLLDQASRGNRHKARDTLKAAREVQRWI